MSAGRFGVTRPIMRADIDGAWLVVVIRPDRDHPAPTARHIDTYKIGATELPEDPELVPKLVSDLRELADELEAAGWAKAWQSR